jgi:hypothetical protein
MVIVQRQPDLLQVVAALRAPRRFPRLLHRRQQQGDEDGDDRDHHQQFDQRESSQLPSVTCHEWTPQETG